MFLLRFLAVHWAVRRSPRCRSTLRSQPRSEYRIDNYRVTKSTTEVLSLKDYTYMDSGHNKFFFGGGASKTEVKMCAK